MMKFLISYLLARITLTLMSSSNYTGCFQKVNFTKSFILDVSLGSEYVSNYRFWMRLYYFFHFESIKFRSSRSQMPFKIKVFKNFTIFTGVIFSYFSEDCTQKKDVFTFKTKFQLNQ